MASAKIIMARVFNELCIADISWPQLQAAAKTPKVPLRGSELRSKEVLISNVAQALIDQEYVKIPCKKISREDLQILKPF